MSENSIPFQVSSLVTLATFQALDMANHYYIGKHRYKTLLAPQNILLEALLLLSKTIVYGICTLTHAPGYFLFLVMWQFENYSY